MFIILLISTIITITHNDAKPLNCPGGEVHNGPNGVPIAKTKGSGSGSGFSSFVKSSFSTNLAPLPGLGGGGGKNSNFGGGGGGVGGGSTGGLGLMSPNSLVNAENINANIANTFGPANIHQNNDNNNDKNNFSVQRTGNGTNINCLAHASAPKGLTGGINANMQGGNGTIIQTNDDNKITNHYQETMNNYTVFLTVNIALPVNGNEVDSMSIFKHKFMGEKNGSKFSL